MSIKTVIMPNCIMTDSEVDATIVVDGRTINIEMHPFCGPSFFYADDDSEDFTPEEGSKIWELLTPALMYSKAEKMAQCAALSRHVRDLKELGIKCYSSPLEDGFFGAGCVDLDDEDVMERIDRLVIEGIKSDFMVMQYGYATHRILDSVWTLVYKIIDDGSIEVLSHNRGNLVGYVLEKTLPKFMQKEEGKRHMVSVEIKEGETVREFKVTNPKNVFMYYR